MNDAALGTLSAAYAAAGDFDAAKKWLKKSIELNNSDDLKEVRDKMLAAYEAREPYIEESSNK